MQLILASTSIYRRQLLEKLHIPFQTLKPEVDETPLPDEGAADLVERLSIAKAKKVAQSIDDGWIIGSDQVATFEGKILGKPHNVDNAVAQLQACQGKTVTFLTGLCLLNAKTGQYQSMVEPFQVHFKSLNLSQIRRYVDIEQPLDCAGSFKSEGLGISLFDALQGRDPNSLIGLPLISLIELFKNAGVDVFDMMSTGG